MSMIDALNLNNGLNRFNGFRIRSIRSIRSIRCWPSSAGWRFALCVVCFIASLLATAQRMPAQDSEGKSLDEILQGLGGTDRSWRGTPGAERSVGVPIHFEYNSAVISPVSRQQLATVAAALDSEALRGDRVRIEGHTDSRGSDAYNLSLSERRAQAVRAYLIDELGIAPGRLVARGYGESRPLPDVSEDTDSGRAANRRVEFVNMGAMSAQAPAAPKPTPVEPRVAEDEEPPAPPVTPRVSAPAKPTAAPPRVAAATPVPTVAAPRVDEPTPAAVVAAADLGVSMTVTYAGEGDEHPLPPGGVLRTNSRYRVRFTPARDAYVYVYQFDSAGKGQALFPNPELAAADNPVSAGRTYHVPAGGEWLTLVGARGREVIIALAASAEIRDPKAAAFREWDAVRGIGGVRPGEREDERRDPAVLRLEFEHQ